jgi:hypothetical protein
VYEDNFGLTERDVGYNMLMLTILNIQSDKSKLIISYLSIFAITFIVYIQIFKLWRTTSVWGDMNFDRGQDLYFSEMKNYVVLVRGIPTNLNPEVASVEIKNVLQETYGSLLIDFKIVGDYRELHMQGRRWSDLCDQLKLSRKRANVLKLDEKRKNKP